MKNKKSRKQFTNNKNRNKHWTEEPKGRIIDFAEKYAEGDGYSDKYDETRRSYYQLAKRKIEKRNKIIKRIVAIVLCVVIVGVGYTLMDVHMIRQAEPAEALINENSVDNGSFSQTTLQLYSTVVDGVSFDNSAMLDSVINDVHDIGFNSITFDAKRNDGTIGYKSELAMVDTYGAMNNVGSNTKASITKLIDNDILPVARVCCYMDNVLPSQNTTLSIMDGGDLYTDSKGNNYLNPDNEDVYGYIYDIIRELSNMGVKVFVLYGCDLPDDISSNYNDGFDNLVEKLNSDFGGDIKFVSQVDETIDGKDKETDKYSDTLIKEEIEEFPSIDNNQIYSISTLVDSKDLISILTEQGINNFILE